MRGSARIWMPQATVIHEAATDVISQEQAKGCDAPWEEPNFVDEITHMQKERQMNAARDLQFYDRSPFCTYALGKYLAHWKNIEFKPSPVLLDEIDRCLKNNAYQNQVFFFENLGFIELTFTRKISYEDALIFEQIHLDVYKEFGFDIIMVPKGLKEGYEIIAAYELDEVIACIGFRFLTTLA
jgi:predicted ATPase